MNKIGFFVAERIANLSALQCVAQFDSLLLNFGYRRDPTGERAT
jgi:hypothetical protein